MITTIEQLKETIPTITGDDLSVYQGAIDRARRWIDRDVLGADVAMADDELLEQKIDTAVSYRAYREVIPMLDLINTGNGFIVVNNESNSPASRERVAALVASMDRSLIDALADIYEYIEDNKVLADKFITFVGSTIITDSLLPTLREFRNYGAFANGYADWIATRAKHRQIICIRIRPRFTAPLISAVIADPSTERFVAIIDPLRYAFAALMTDDLNTAQAMMTVVENELMAHPDKYPEHIPIALKQFESTSTISFI